MSEVGRSHNDVPRDRSSSNERGPNSGDRSPSRGNEQSRKEGQRVPDFERGPNSGDRSQIQDRTLYQASNTDSTSSRNSRASSVFSDRVSDSHIDDNMLPAAGPIQAFDRLTVRMAVRGQLDFGELSDILNRESRPLTTAEEDEAIKRTEEHFQRGNPNQAGPVEQGAEGSNMNATNRLPTRMEVYQRFFLERMAIPRGSFASDARELLARQDRTRNNPRAGDRGDNLNQASPAEQRIESPNTDATDQHPSLEELRIIRTARFSGNNSNERTEPRQDEENMGH